MTDLTTIQPKIENKQTQIQANNFELEVVPKESPNATYKVTYKNHQLVEEDINTERLQQYEQVATYFDMWVNDEDLPDIGNWTNLYGDPYWRHKEHSLQFRINGVFNSYRYKHEKQVKSPEYFNPSCFKQYHRTEESAILTLLLTLIRYTPQEAAYQHHYQRSIIKQLQEIYGIGETISKDLYDLGVRDYPDIKENDHKLESNYRNDTFKEINEKIEQGVTILEETDFLDDYNDQYIANNI